MPPDVDLGFTKNEKYDRILRDYYHCSFTYLSQFEFVYQYEKQLKRRDVDTVCAFELYQMKRPSMRATCSTCQASSITKIGLTPSKSEDSPL